MLIALQIPADAQTLLVDGAYEIDVTLELPSVLDTHAHKQARLCLSQDSGASFGLSILSENNPLAKCPISNAQVSDGLLTFDVACPGVNAASGHAKYVVSAESFRGRIEMKMGGKNMTMTEVQAGRRIGRCDILRAQ